jgi:hypothetical protein
MRWVDWWWQTLVAALLSTALAEVVLIFLLLSADVLTEISVNAMSIPFVLFGVLMMVVIAIIPAMLVGAPIAVMLGGALYAAGMIQPWARRRSAWALLGTLGGLAGKLIAELWFGLDLWTGHQSGAPLLSFAIAGAAGALFFRRTMIGLAPVGGWEPAEQN